MTDKDIIVQVGTSVEVSERALTFAEKQKKLAEQAYDIFRAFAALREEGTALYVTAEAMELVSRWHGHINDNFYKCDIPTLLSLAPLYDSDPQYKMGVDRFGAGTAEFMAAAIRLYCERAEYCCKCK